MIHKATAKCSRGHSVEFGPCNKEITKFLFLKSTCASELNIPGGKGPADIKNIYSNASFLADNRVVFNIKGNKYRVVVAVQYDFGIVYIRFAGTHKDYDKIDVATI